MYFNNVKLTFSCRTKVCDEIRSAAAAANKRKISVSISKRYAENNCLPVDIYGKPEKITIDYSGELLIFRFDDGSATLMEDASDALLVTAHMKLKDMGVIQETD